MKSLKQVLMRRDNLTSEEAQSLINEAREDLYDRLESGELVDDSDFCADWFGLEPDYILEVI